MNPVSCYSFWAQNSHVFSEKIVLQKKKGRKIIYGRYLWNFSFWCSTSAPFPSICNLQEIRLVEYPKRGVRKDFGVTNSGNFRIILSSWGKTRRALIDSSNHGLIAGGWIGKHFLAKSSKIEWPKYLKAQGLIFGFLRKKTKQQTKTI